MAITRPVRLLGLAAMMMWIFFIYQALKPTRHVERHSPEDSLPSFERDPMNDREFPLLVLCVIPETDLYVSQQRRVSRTVSYAEHQNSMRQGSRSLHESRPHYCRLYATRRWMAWYRLCVISSEHGTTSSTTLGPSSTMSRSRRNSRGRRGQLQRQSVDTVRQIS